MSATAPFFALAAMELAGLFAIWFFLKRRIGRYLELENLLDGVREEARGLIRELNETADRSVSLVEDRMDALGELLDEVDRRIGVERKERETRAVEREVYAKLARRRPIVPSAEPFPEDAAAARPERSAEGERAAAIRAEAPLLDFTGASPDARGVRADGPAGESSGAARSDPPREPPSPAGLGGANEGPIQLSLGQAASESAPGLRGRAAPEVSLSDDLLVSSRSKREEALDLHRKGISAELIAARLGATVAEIELLVEMEERRAEGGGGVL